MKTSYRQRDATFGLAILKLRTTMGLTQARLANRLGLSQKAVGEWETGKRYPKAEHLKALMALAVKSQAFANGNAAEEIRLLWQATGQKELLDECWLSALLDHQLSPPSHVEPEPVETMSNAPVMVRSTLEPRVDWGDAPTTSVFYGREEELALLSQWVVQEHCRVISVLGMGGIGKSALSVSLMYQLALGTLPCACPFEVVIFRSLRDAPSCEMLLDECLQVLSPQPLRVVPVTLERRISLLLSHLLKARVLLVLDNLESLLKEGDTKGHLRPDVEGYGLLLHRVAETAHQSCLLLTSRERPAELRHLESRYSQVRSLRLAGLEAAACKQILEEKEVLGTPPEQEQLIQIYGGNPLALKIVAETIVDLFGGQIGQFLAQSVVIFGNIADLLDEQFARLSPLEQGVLCWLAIAREPMSLDELLAVLVRPLPRTQLLEGIDSLRRRSLIEPGKYPGSFTLQSVVLEYVTAFLIAEANHEIQQRRLTRLIQYGLSQATAHEYVRQTQERLLLCPLLANLQSGSQTQAAGAGQAQGTVPKTPVEGKLLNLLDELRKRGIPAQGYGPANLIALLRIQRGHLNALDLSQLSIRGAYLQSIEMHDASLAGSLMRDTTFTEAVSAIRTVAISPDGKWWAAGGMEGKVRIWDEGGQILQRIWQAHTDMVYALAFSPDGRTLASGSRDGTIKLWNVEGATPIWTNWQNIPVSLAFTPDGSLLASAGLDATVRLWDPQSGTNLQTLRHPSYVYAVTWSPDGHLLASGGVDGTIRLWEKQKALPSTCIEIHSMQSNWVMSLAFAPDGRTLASGHWDQTVKLWEMGSLRLLHTLSGQTDRANSVVWSPDGCILACCNKDKTIWLWDVERGNYRAVLRGHTAAVSGIAFTPNSSHLLSSSEDNTLRVWNMESCQCVRVITGYAVSLYDIDWSPDGTHLSCGGTDGLVTIWDLNSGTPPRELHGHTWTVSGVGWSPEGRFLASCGWDTTLRLWDPTSGACVQMFQDPSALLQKIAWSPDGRLLACGTYLRGMQVWDVTARSLRWVGLPHQTTFFGVAWSPDGTRLVGSCGDGDGSLYLWEGMDGTGQVPCKGASPLPTPTRLAGHQSRVTSVVWSLDGRLLASCSGNRGCGEVFVWDVQNRERVRTLAGHPGIVSALAWCRSRTEASHSPYDPCEDRLVSGGSDGMLRWWDVLTGECVSMQEAHHGMIRSLKVSPDEKLLASCGDDGAIMIWDQHSGKHLRTLRRDRPYERMNITGIKGLNEAQKATLRALGAFEIEGRVS